MRGILAAVQAVAFAWPRPACTACPLRGLYPAHSLELTANQDLIPAAHASEMAISVQP